MRIVEHGRNGEEIDAVLDEIGLSFAVVPFEGVVTSAYFRHFVLCHCSPTRFGFVPYLSRRNANGVGVALTDCIYNCIPRNSRSMKV